VKALRTFLQIHKYTSSDQTLFDTEQKEASEEADRSVAALALTSPVPSFIVNSESERRHLAAVEDNAHPLKRSSFHHKIAFGSTGIMSNQIVVSDHPASLSALARNWALVIITLR
jgi:hypothetical protein